MVPQTVIICSYATIIMRNRRTMHKTFAKSYRLGNCDCITYERCA